MKMRMVFVLAALAVGGQTQAQVVSGAPYVAVHGEANEEVTPDVFPLELTLSSTSKDAAGTQARIESLAGKILEIANGMKVADADLTVANMTISPQYDYDDDDGKQIFQGNEYKRQIKLRFHALERMRNFISALPQDDALRIQTGAFQASRQEEIKRELMGKAIANARATAEALAAGVGRKLGPVHTISNRSLNVGYSEATPLGSVAVTGTRALMAPGVVGLREGRITLDQDVYIVYALED